MSTTSRFWAKVDKKAEDECWLWQASRKGAYGGFVYNKKFCLAHRVSAYIHGIIPDLGFDKRHVVMHICDTPLCVNPKHLVIGTQKDNIKDRDNKGRRPPYHGNPAFGERHGCAKLSADDVRNIRWLSSLGLSSSEISGVYCMEKTTIQKITNRKLWASVA